MNCTISLQKLAIALGVSALSLVVACASPTDTEVEETTPAVEVEVETSGSDPLTYTQAQLDSQCSGVMKPRALCDARNGVVGLYTCGSKSWTPCPNGWRCSPTSLGVVCRAY